MLAKIVAMNLLIVMKLLKIYINQKPVILIFNLDQIFALR